MGFFNKQSSHFNNLSGSHHQSESRAHTSLFLCQIVLCYILFLAYY